jgi:glutathione S-transferase
LEPIYEELASTLRNKAVIAKVDCVQEPFLQQAHGIRGFPTIKLFKDGTSHDYRDGRDVNSFIAFLQAHNAIREKHADSPKAGDAAVELRYFMARGRAEVIRLTLEELGIAYKDTRYTSEEWPKHKPNSQIFPFAQMPSLSIDGLDLVQTQAILRYLGRRNGLYGDSNVESTMIDLVIGGFEDLGTKYGALVYDSAFEQKRTKYVEEVLPVWLGHFDRLLLRNQNGSGFYVGSKLTIADIVAYDSLSLQLDLAPACLQPFPVLQRYYQRIHARPAIQSYLMSPRRPKFAHGVSAFWNNEARPPNG